MHLNFVPIGIIYKVEQFAHEKVCVYSINQIQLSTYNNKYSVYEIDNFSFETSRFISVGVYLKAHFKFFFKYADH